MRKWIISPTLLHDDKKRKASFRTIKFIKINLSLIKPPNCNISLSSETSSPAKIKLKLTCKITLRMSSLTGSVKDWHVPWKHQRTMPPLENIVKRSNITLRISSGFFYVNHFFCRFHLFCACTVNNSQNAPRVHSTNPRTASSRISRGNHADRHWTVICTPSARKKDQICANPPVLPATSYLRDLQSR